MISQRLNYNADGSADLVIHAETPGLVELIGLAEELKLRSTVETQGPIHRLNDPTQGTPSVPDYTVEG